MAISVKADKDPDEETERLLLKGLDEALQLRISHLFEVLCSGCASDAPSALDKFSNGVNIARRAYLDARIIVDAKM